MIYRGVFTIRFMGRVLRIITETKVKQAMLKYPQWLVGLTLWVNIFKQGELNFESYQQIKDVWKSASGWNVDRIASGRAKPNTFGGDFDFYIFDIHKTNCRVVTRINSVHNRIYIRFVGSHAKYDEWCKAHIK